MPTPPAMRDVETVLRDMLAKYAGGRQVELRTELHHHLGLAGDDAVEFLNEVARRFEVSFSRFQFADDFPDETEALGDHALRLIGVRSRKKPLAFGHLVRVVKAGGWFEP